jgi:hypothetical protein
VELDQECGVQCEMSGGKLKRAEAFPSWTDALEAAGLQE